MAIKEKKIKETTQHFSIPNSFKTIFSTGDSGREIAKEVKKTINTNDATSKKDVNFASIKIGSLYNLNKFSGLKSPKRLSEDVKKRK